MQSPPSLCLPAMPRAAVAFSHGLQPAAIMCEAVSCTSSAMSVRHGRINREEKMM